MDFSLISSLPLFFAALFLLWFPVSVSFSGESRRRLSARRTGSEFPIVGALAAWQNWADFGRAFAGCQLLFGAVFGLTEENEWEVFIWQASILLLALLIQMIRRRRGRFYFPAPLFFVWGLTFALSAPILAVYAIAAGLLAGMVSDLEWALPVMAVVLGVLGYFFSGMQLSLVLNVILIGFPLIVAFCGRGHLVLLTRERSRIAEVRG